MRSPIHHWLSVAEAASAVSVSPEIILAAIHNGALIASNVGMGKCRPRWRIAEADLNQWLADRQSVPAQRSRQRRRTMEIPTYV